MKKILFIIFILISQASCITLTEDKFFFPEKHEPLSGLDMGVFVRKTISFSPEKNVNLSGILLKHNSSDDYLIYFYGNGESIYESRKRLYYLCEKYSLNIICFDYRGYGESTGSPSFRALLDDSVKIYNFVINKYNPEQLFVFSQSIGTVPAAKIGSKKKPAGIIMEAPFTNAKEGVSRMTEGLIPPFCWLIKLKAEKRLINMEPQPVDMIKNFSSPLLIIHGTGDETFPFDIGKKMAAAAGSDKKTFCPLPGAGHADVKLNKGAALKCLNDFFEMTKN